MIRRLAVLVMAAVLLSAVPASAITSGQPDAENIRTSGN
jgi:hypothetical protein